MVVVDSSALTFVPGERAASALATDRITVARCDAGTSMPSWLQAEKLLVGSFIGLTVASRMPYADRMCAATRARSQAE